LVEPWVHRITALKNALHFFGDNADGGIAEVVSSPRKSTLAVLFSSVEPWVHRESFILLQ